MDPKIEAKFTKYEIARIIGARALQIAMDAPVLIKISEDELKAMRYDAIKIAERELELDALPITVNRPMPQKKKEKLATIKEEKVSDEEIEAKGKEVEKDIREDPEEFSLAEEEEHIEELDAAPHAEEQ